MDDDKNGEASINETITMYGEDNNGEDDVEKRRPVALHGVH